MLGKAPDALEGVIMPELSLADALGAVGKPIHRVHTAGSVGASTAISAAVLVESGRYDTVLTVTYEKQSEGNATWALSGGKSGGQGAGGTFAPWIREYIRRSKAPEHIGWTVAVKDRLNALKNPYAHLHLEDISVDMVRESPMLWDPLHFLESCPSSDGAAAMVLTSEDKVARSPHPPAWVLGHAKRTEFSTFPGRHDPDPGGPRLCRRALQEGGDHQPPQADRRRRAVRAVQLVRADVARRPSDRRGGRGLEDDRRGRHRARRRLPGQLLGGRAVVESDRRAGHDPLPRSGQSGARHCRRLSSRRREGRARARLRGCGAVLAMWIVASELQPDFS
ncbi:MAG: hypothetical protein R2695_13475 [Acidimicrobiales bacterium]